MLTAVMQALDSTATSFVPQPEFVIALDVLRKELDERMGAARAAGEQVDGNIKETLQQVGFRSYQQVLAASILSAAMS